MQSSDGLGDSNAVTRRRTGRQRFTLRVEPTVALRPVGGAKDVTYETVDN